MAKPPEPSQPQAEVEARPPLSVVVPVLNEAPGLSDLVSQLLPALPPNAEVIFVDDGSSDATPRLLAELGSRDPRVRVVRFRRQFGKSMALLAGFRRVRGDVVATIDADLQEDPAAIQQLRSHLDRGFDLVVGYRRRRQDPMLKVLGSRAFNLLTSLLSGVRFRDINCGLKVMRREVVDALVIGGGFHRFLPLLAQAQGFRVTEVEVEHRARRHGKSRYTSGRILRGLLDLAVILFLARHDGRPTRVFVGAGALLGSLGAAISAYLAFLRLSQGSIQSRYPLLGLGLVLMVVGVQVFSLGLFGELLAHHFRSRQPFEPALWDDEKGSGLR